MENNLLIRKNHRLSKQNYSSPGAYFITICTYNRERILSHIVGAIHESPAERGINSVGAIHESPADRGISSVGAIHESPEVILTEYGRIVEGIINNLPDHLCVTVDKYVIMPNHVHIIFSITRADAERAIRESPLRSKSLISSAVGFIKMNSTKAIRQEYGEIAVWQRSFYDHIIRNEQDYYETAKYIEENPLKWKFDELYSE